MAHWYASRLPHHCTLVSCSLGSSILQVHQAAKTSVDRLETSAELIRTLVGPAGNRPNCVHISYDDGSTHQIPTTNMTHLDFIDVYSV